MSSPPRPPGPQQRHSNINNASGGPSQSSPSQQARETGHWKHRSSNHPTPEKRFVPTQRGRSPSPSPNRAAYRKLFGLNQPTTQSKVPGKFDFEDKYPEDPIYEEMGPNARLWRAFLDECEVFDNDMVTESRDGLDLLLVFAGLFSAVLSTFVAQTSQALSTNLPAVSSSLLVEMVALQRAQINEIPIDDIPPTDTNAGPSGFDVWVNVLWFTSLTLSLGTALMAVLVKQWLYQYMSMISGTARDRSLIRFYRFEGLQQWHVLVIIGTLPIVLHIALGLFLAGLVVFLVPLNIPLACVVGFITLIIYTLYAVSNILPIIYIQCPYRTPFSDILNVMLRAVRRLPSSTAMHIHKLGQRFNYAISTSPMAPETVFTTLRETERIAATNDEVAEEVAWRALLWMYQMTSNPPTKRIIQESVGCLSDGVAKRSMDLQADLEQTLREISPPTGDHERGHWYRSIPSGQARRVERILRAIREPLAPRESLEVSNAPWRLDLATDSEFLFQPLTSILVHAPNTRVETESGLWDFPSLRKYIIGQQFSHAPIHLPPRLWTLLVTLVSTNRPLTEEDTIFLEQLCIHAVKSFDNLKQLTDAPPFAGPVTFTHKTVKLFYLVADLPQLARASYETDAFDFAPLTKLFIIYDHAASRSSLDFNSTTTENLVVLGDTWASITRLDTLQLHEDDKQLLCRRVENAITQMTLSADWWDSEDEGRRCRCYRNVIGAYRIHMLFDWHTQRSGFLQKPLADFSFSLSTNDPEFIQDISTTLSDHHKNAPIYYFLFCASPFLSSSTPSSFQNCRRFLYPIVSVFVDNMPRSMSQECMESLCADPQRLFTLYRIIMLGPDPNLRMKDPEEHIRQCLWNLAHKVDTSHAVWTNRVHYMTMEPHDWPYLHLRVDKELGNGKFIAWVNGRMKKGLHFLDHFFAYLTTPPSAPEALRGVPQKTAPKSASHWRHLRRLVSGTGVFPKLFSASRGSPSNVANDVELGVQVQAPKGTSDEGPHTDSDVHTVHSTTRHSSLSSDVSHTDLLAVPRSESPTPQESSSLSVSPSEMSSQEEKEDSIAEVASDESLHTNILTTPARASHSNVPIERASETRRSRSPGSMVLEIALQRPNPSRGASDGCLRSRQNTNSDDDDTIQRSDPSDTHELLPMEIV